MATDASIFLRLLQRLRALARKKLKALAVGEPVPHLLATMLSHIGSLPSAYAYAAQINSLQALLLQSEPYLGPAFCLCMWILILIKTFYHYRKMAVRADRLEADLVAFKAQIGESIELLSACMQKTIKAANTAIDDMIVIQDGGLRTLQKELRSGTLALEVREIKASTSESIQALQINYAHLNQRYAELPSTEDVQKDINERLQEWFDDLGEKHQTLSTSLHMVQHSLGETGDAVLAMGRSLTLQGEAIEKVMAWAKQGRWQSPLGGSTNWALVSQPKW